MELKGVFIIMLCLSLFALQTPCTSLQIQLQSSNEQAKRVEISPNPPLLPRKLRFIEEHVLKGNVPAAQHFISSNKKENVSGKAKQKEQGRRQEWGEEDYFTMDYSHVRRRRPIHNKSLPLGP